MRVDSQGHEYISVRRVSESYDMTRTKQLFIENRRKKLSKNQRALAKKEAEALRDAQRELKKQNEGEIVEFGESVMEEE